jgi:Ca2+:H+ antiporter
MANAAFRQASAQDRKFRMDSLRDRLLPLQPLTPPAFVGRSVPLSPRLMGSRAFSSDREALVALIRSDKTWLLLPLVVVGVVVYYMNCSPGLVFLINFLGMIPLARILGDSTEELAAGLRNDTVGALLNATFGNAVEMIITYQTIAAGLVTVTKSSLLGSILSNLLLVLGSSFFFGGIGSLGKQQEFQESGPLVSMSMLLLTCIGFSVPTVVAASTHQAVLSLSRVASLSILLSYAALLIYQLYTHRKEFEDASEDNEESSNATMSVKASAILLFVTTLLTALSSKCIVDCIEGVVDEWGLSQAFIGVVLLPIIGNACEHVSAIRMAIHDKPLLSIGIAVGSSCQIAMFVIPLAVILGWAMGVPMDLDFDVLNVVILAFSVVIVTIIVVDGKSTWIEGFMLVMAYFIVGAAYWYDSVDPFSTSTP